MSEVTFDDYTYHAWNTSYFLNETDETQRRNTLFYGFNEEVNELLTDTQHPKELTAKLWGWEVDQDIDTKLSADKTSETGDILFYISAIARVHNISLTTIMREGADRYTGGSLGSSCETFQQFDEEVHGRMGNPVPKDYRPDYSKWKLWDFAPYESTLEILLREPTYAKGPLRLLGDGRYALDRLCNNLGQYFLSERISEDEFVSSAGLAVGALSLVMQHRFDSSLASAATNNISKRERRVQMDILEDGDDPERSRPKGKERLKIDLQESTEMNLLNAELPDL